MENRMRFVLEIYKAIRKRVGKSTTGIKTVDVMFMLVITWYESQLALLTKCREPKHDLSTWRVVFQMPNSMGIYAIAKRRV